MLSCNSTLFGGCCQNAGQQSPIELTTKVLYLLIVLTKKLTLCSRVQEQRFEDPFISDNIYKLVVELVLELDTWSERDSSVLVFLPGYGEIQVYMFPPPPNELSD